MMNGHSCIWNKNKQIFILFDPISWLLHERMSKGECYKMQILLCCFWQNSMPMTQDFSINLYRIYIVHCIHTQSNIYPYPVHIFFLQSCDRHREKGSETVYRSNASASLINRSFINATPLLMSFLNFNVSDATISHTLTIITIWVNGSPLDTI